MLAKGCYSKTNKFIVRGVLMNKDQGFSSKFNMFILYSKLTTTEKYSSQQVLLPHIKVLQQPVPSYVN